MPMVIEFARSLGLTCFFSKFCFTFLLFNIRLFDNSNGLRFDLFYRFSIGIFVVNLFIFIVFFCSYYLN
jgi:hypothetical protein